MKTIELINATAGKLMSDGLTVGNYTKAKAKEITKRVVSSTSIHNVIDKFSKEIKNEMRSIYLINKQQLKT